MISAVVWQAITTSVRSSATAELLLIITVKNLSRPATSRCENLKSLQNGREISKPLIQYTLERLYENDQIDEIVIVGHQMLLEQSFRNFIKKFAKPCRIVNQNSKISGDIIRQFNIKPRKVKYNSIAGNFIKGYAATKACRENRHALFVASDSPLTTNEFVNRFLKKIQQYQDEADIMVPAIFNR